MREEIARLKKENAALRDENASLSANLDSAMLACADLRALPPGGKMLVFDGWNLILGADRTSRSREELVAKVKAHLAKSPEDFAWIVFDGPRENVSCEGRLRVSYTGGTGQQRADRQIAAYVRMARYLGLDSKVEVVTNDKALRKVQSASA